MKLAVVSHACARAMNRFVYAELAKKGVDVRLLVAAEIYEEKADPVSDSEPPIEFVRLRGLSPRTYRFSDITAELARIDPDVVLLDADPVSLSAIEIGYWCLRRSKRFACLSNENFDITVGAQIRRQGMRNIPAILARRTMSLLARPAVDQVFTINADGTRIFQQRGFGKVCQVPLGFSPTTFFVDQSKRVAMRHALGIQEDTVVFACFGRLAREKGIHLVIEALGEVFCQDPSLGPWRLLLDRFQEIDDYSRVLSTLTSKHRMKERVMFVDADHSGIGDYMRACDVAILASLQTPTVKEQYGRVVPEAMACGALAVVSDSGAPKDLVGDCGVVFPAGDSSALKGILLRILRNPMAFDELRSRGAQRAHARLGVGAQANRMKSALEALL